MTNVVVPESYNVVVPVIKHCGLRVM